MCTKQAQNEHQVTETYFAQLESQAILKDSGISGTFSPCMCDMATLKKAAHGCFFFSLEKQIV